MGLGPKNQLNREQQYFLRREMRALFDAHREVERAMFGFKRALRAFYTKVYEMEGRDIRDKVKKQAAKEP